MLRLQTILQAAPRQGGRAAAVAALAVCVAFTIGGSLALAQASSSSSARPAAQPSASDLERIRAASEGLDIVTGIAPGGLWPAPTAEVRAQRIAARQELSRLRSETRALRTEYRSIWRQRSAAADRKDLGETDRLNAHLDQLGDDLDTRRVQMEGIVARHWPEPV